MTNNPLVPDRAGTGGRTVALSVDDGYQSIYANVFPLLAECGMTMTLALVVDYVGIGPVRRHAATGYLNKSEVCEMLDTCGIEIASHSLSHPFLTRLSDDLAWAEIRQSKVALEAMFGMEISTFVYPYGDVDARICDMVQQAGYTRARTVLEGTPDVQSAPYQLPAFDIRRRTPVERVKHHVATRETSILLLHQAVSNPRVYTQWDLTSFVGLVRWMHDASIQTTTLSHLAN